MYNEGENVVVLHRKLREDAVPYDSLRFVYDLDDDTSLPYVAKLARRGSACRRAAERSTDPG